jgi:hypothetical protein
MPKKPTPPPPPETDKTPPGPAPDTLKLEGDWEANVAKSLAKRKPAGGWPKPDDDAK